jgi:hypothetical protein
MEEEEEARLWLQLLAAAQRVAVDVPLVLPIPTPLVSSAR